jgi:putative membrane protein
VAALVIALVHPDAEVARAFAVFGLICVAVAGIWGAATVKKTILYVQTLPALLGLASLFFL